MIQRRSAESPVPPIETSRRRTQTSDYLSGLAVVLSALAFIVSGFNAYQIAGLRGEIQLANNTAADPTASTIAPPLSNQQNTATQAPPAQTQTQTTVTTTPVQPDDTNSTVQPGQFIQPALNGTARVEIVSVERVQNTQTGRNDLVEVQLRVQRTGDRASSNDIINFNETTALNPDTKTTYPTVNRNQSGGAVSLFQVNPGSASEVEVQFAVPENIETLNIVVPETGVFNNVPVN
jgi:hypothetical protein